MNTPDQQTTQPRTEICLPVSESFGSIDPNELTEMMTYTDASELSSSIADQVSWTHAERDGDVESGIASVRAIKALGCETCVLAGCQVRDILNEQGPSSPERQTLAVIDQLLSAPKWLKAARVNVFGQEEFDKLAAPEYVKQQMQKGELNPVELLGDTESTFIGTADPRTIPELANVNLKEGAEHLERHVIKKIGEKGPGVEVIDATAAVDTGVEPAETTQLMNLVNKLLTRIRGVDERGMPQILTPDSKMQSSLHVKVQPGAIGRFDELRMNGKNRLYLVVTPPKDSEPARVVILGSHGGDAKTQERLIANVIVSPQKARVHAGV